MNQLASSVPIVATVGPAFDNAAKPGLDIGWSRIDESATTIPALFAAAIGLAMAATGHPLRVITAGLSVMASSNLAFRSGTVPSKTISLAVQPIVLAAIASC